MLHYSLHSNFSTCTLRSYLLQAITANMEKLQDMIRCFNGTGEVDIVTWLAKVKLVAKLKKIEDLSALIPLYLDGAAFAV